MTMIKSLEWRYYPDAFPPAWDAPTPWGRYSIEEETGDNVDDPALHPDVSSRWVLYFNGQVVSGHKTLDAAKAAAQADYATRIRSALEPSPAHPVASEECRHCHGTGQPNGIKGGPEHGECSWCDGSGRTSASPSPAPVEAEVREAVQTVPDASERLGKWMSAAQDDPGVCAEMKADISAWFTAGQPLPSPDDAPADFEQVAANAWDFVRPKLVALNKEKGPAGVWSNGFRSGWDNALRALSPAQPGAQNNGVVGEAK
jgi:hypothetical protein